ncbi:MAG: hypothetical protein JKY66_09945 [Spongiibacteraceae bacterium]|nr:hypothetical protein [Spongiibacteraceae bacterium]
MVDKGMSREDIFKIVENQIRYNKPKETKITLNRLISQGISYHDAMIHIAFVVSREVFEIIHEGKIFNEKNYEIALKDLPNASRK